MATTEQSAAEVRFSRASMREWLYAAIFLAPNIVGIGLFVVVPLIAGLAISFTDWDLLGEAGWVGVDNYVALWNDPVFWLSLRNTLIYTVVVIPGGLTLSLLLALGLSGSMRGTRFYQAIFFLPYVSSTVAVGLVWKWIYNPDYGVLNTALRTFGLPAPNWLGDTNIALVSLALITIWQTTGYNMVLFVAGLRSIPKHYYEAARIDGAGPITLFFRITLPLLMPTVFFVSATSLIASFQVFNLVFVTTKGGPGNSTKVYVQYLWENGFSFFNMGYASAMAYVLFLVMLVVTILQVRLMGRSSQFR